MKIPKLNLYEKIEIIWLDSIHDSGWKFLNSLKFDFHDKEKITHCTIGYFISKNELSLVVAQSIQKKTYDDNDKLIDARMEIPICAILEIKKLK